MTAVEQAYHHWLQADPLMGLRMALTVPDVAPGWPRTEIRVVGMLLQAVPKDIYEDIVANRHMSAGHHVQAAHHLFNRAVKWRELLCYKCWWTGKAHPIVLHAQFHPDMEKMGRTSIDVARSSGFGRSARKNE